LAAGRGRREDSANRGDRRGPPPFPQSYLWLTRGFELAERQLVFAPNRAESFAQTSR
jgi:hypothetical protein